jgi:hypothetical protein
MKSILTGATGLALLVASVGPATAQDLASQIVGVWKRVSQVQKDVNTGVTTMPLGEHPTGSAVFTRGGHFFWIQVADGRRAPESWVPTDADRVALYNTAAFGSGTYKVDGDTATLIYDSSSGQSWTGTQRRAQLQVSGKVLTWTSAPIWGADSKQYVSIVTMERVE